MDAKPISRGESINVQTFRGVKGNIVGKLPDGRTIIFDRDSPYLNMLGPGQSVECNIVHVSQRYVIVDPMKEPEPRERTRRPVGETEPMEEAKPPETETYWILENLRRLSKEGEWEKAAMARSLIHIIEKLEASRKPPKTSLTSIDETLLDQSLKYDLRRAFSSFGLTQLEVMERTQVEKD